MLAVLLGVLLWPAGSALHVVDLHSLPWTLANGNGSVSVAVPNATNTHLNLMQAGILQGDPYYRDNELAWSWVAQDTWTYSTSFPSTPAMLSESSQVLRCQVDTVSTVFLNGREVGKTYSAFVVSEFNVTGLLSAKGKANTLKVVIYPALKYAQEQGEKYPYPVPAGAQHNTWTEGDKPDTSGWGNSNYTWAHRSFVRKAPSDFGWDWGPAFVPSGVVGLSLVARSGAALVGTVVRQQHKDGSVVLSVEAHLTVVEACEASLVATLRAPDGSTTHCVAAKRPLKLPKPGASVALLELRVERPQLWWPAGMGGQPLYELELQLDLADGGKGSGGKLRRRIGLRTAELVQEPMHDGASFFFRVNGVGVFAKGANLVPMDAFAPRAAEKIEWILRSAKDANMNMVRVWGGGYYQPDEFYDFADEFGLMIWQEFVFACSMYPTDKAFLGLVTKEVEQQVARLQHHASVVVWGGNNENEPALGWYAASRQNHDRYAADFVKLYIDTAMAALRRVDPDVAFTDSSPTNGLISKTPYVKRWGDSGDGKFGDIHYYNYYDDCEEAEHYPRARFISEHGFQSFPSFQAYKHVLAPKDWGRSSPLLDYRQRSNGGNPRLEQMVSKHFNLPPPVAGSEAEQQEVFDNYLYLTQVQQSRCYETALTQWRRLRSDPGASTMGILYWQLDDIWQGPSWATIEWSGAWRLSHSGVQRSFAPVLASAVLTGNNTLQVFLTSDLTEKVSAELHVQLRPWNGAKAHAWFSCKAAVKSGTRLCHEAPLQSALDASGCSRESCFVHLEGATVEKHPKPLSAHAFLTPLKLAELPSANLTVSRPWKLGPRRASLLLTADSVAVYAALESEELVGRFSPNGLLLLPGEPVEIEFLGRSDFDLDKWARGLRARSLRDTYKEAPKPEEAHVPLGRGEERRAPKRNLRARSGRRVSREAPRRERLSLAAGEGRPGSAQEDTSLLQRPGRAARGAPRRPGGRRQRRRGARRQEL